MKDDRADTRPTQFFLAGGEPGILLIHGFLAAPDEVYPLGKALAAAGMTVSGICLSGHATVPQDLARVRWQDWVADAHAGLAELRRHCKHIGIAGMSLGAALALYIAAEEPIEHLVTFSMPNHTATRGLSHVWAKHLASIIPYLPKISSDMHDPKARQKHTVYRQIPMRAVAELAAFIEATEARLPEVHAPTLLVHARHDRVVPPRAATEIAARLGGPHKVLWIERGGHTIVLDYDCERAWLAARDWFMGSSDMGSSEWRGMDTQAC